MALKLTRALKKFNCFSLSSMQSRHVSQHYPIDEHIFGLSDEQIQVQISLIMAQFVWIFKLCFTCSCVKPYLILHKENWHQKPMTLIRIITLLISEIFGRNWEVLVF